MSPTDGEPTRDPISGIVVLDGELPYLDGSEQPIRDAIERCSDTSSWSDQLWREASSWAERYHLSPQRGSILAPLALGPGVRVLEVGAGTGAVTRAIGETGASVTAVEGNLERARIVAARCADLSNVDVMCGPATSFDQAGSFDVVIGIGVLEYSSTGSGGNSGPEFLLDHLARQLANDGLLALAIENQIGLKYLIGYDEDHLGLPWVGVDGYQSGVGPRTWSKAALGQMFANAGLTAQRWAFPFPDYKFPHVILDESAYEQLDATDLIDGLCRWPAANSAQEPHLLCDSRSAHRVMLDAGLAPSVANSFLIMASQHETGITRHTRPAIAWLTGNRRHSSWQRWRELRRAEEGHREIATIRGSTGSKQLAWLRQLVSPVATWTEGRTLESVLLAAIVQGSGEAVGEILVAWRAELEASASVVATTVRHPFLDDDTTLVVPGDMIDSNFSNWIVVDSGGYELIDREWTAVAGGDLDLVTTRALVYFAHDVVVRGVAHPWGTTATVRDLASTLGALCGCSLTDRLFQRWVDAEAAFQAIVQGVERDDMAEIERRMLIFSRLDPTVRVSLPLVALNRDLGELQLVHEALRVANEGVGVLEREVWGARDYAITIASEISELRRRNLTLSHEYRAVLQHVEGLETIRTHRDDIYTSVTWRLGSALLRPIHLVKSRLPGASHRGSDG